MSSDRTSGMSTAAGCLGLVAIALVPVGVGSATLVVYVASVLVAGGCLGAYALLRADRGRTRILAALTAVAMTAAALAGPWWLIHNLRGAVVAKLEITGTDWAATADDLVLVGSSSSIVLVDRSDGTPRGRIDLDPPLETDQGSVAVSDHGWVFVTRRGYSGDPVLFTAYDNEGKQLWSRGPGAAEPDAPAPKNPAGYTVIAANNESAVLMTCKRACRLESIGRDGETRWQRELPGGSTHLPAYGNPSPDNDRPQVHVPDTVWINELRGDSAYTAHHRRIDDGTHVRAYEETYASVSDAPPVLLVGAPSKHSGRCTVTALAPDEKLWEKRFTDGPCELPYHGTRVSGISFDNAGTVVRLRDGHRRTFAFGGDPGPVLGRDLVRPGQGQHWVIDAATGRSLWSVPDTLGETEAMVTGGVTAVFSDVGSHNPYADALMRSHHGSDPDWEANVVHTVTLAASGAESPTSRCWLGEHENVRAVLSPSMMLIESSSDEDSPTYVRRCGR